MLKNSKEKANADTLESIAVNFDKFTPTQAFTPIEENRIDEKQFQDIGVDLEYLKKSGELDRMLKWQKTDKLIPIVLEIGDTPVRTEARLALRENEEGNLHLAIHAIRKEPNLERPYMGVQFSDEDKKNLLKAIPKQAKSYKDLSNNIKTENYRNWYVEPKLKPKIILEKEELIHKLIFERKKGDFKLKDKIFNNIITHSNLVDLILKETNMMFDKLNDEILSYEIKLD